MVALLLIIATVARVTLINGLGDQGFFDKYLLLATDWNRGLVPVDRFSDVSLLYLLIIRWLEPLLEPVTIRALQIVLTTVAALICGLTARTIAGNLAGWVAGGSLLASRPVLLNATEIEPETFILLAVSLFLYGMTRLDSAQRWPGIVAGLSAGLAIALRPVFLLPFALAIGALLIMRRRQPRGYRAPLVMFALASVPVILLQVWQPVVAEHGTPPMNPGTVFYEGMNPYATGLSGVAPRIVNDLEPSIAQPDPLHIAYRLVAERSSRDDQASNDFWSSKARHYMNDHPRAALRLTLRKLLLSIHAHDAWDLVTIWRKERELAAWHWLPFSLVAAFALGGALLHRRDRRVQLLATVCAGQILVMTIFYVTARQRNALWPGAVILAAIAIPGLVALWKAHRRRFFVALGLLATVAFLLTVRISAVSEDQYGWEASEQSARLRAEAERSPPERRARLLALDRTWLDAADALPTDVPRELIVQAALLQLPSTTESARIFDLGLSLLESDEVERATELFDYLLGRGYRPERGNLIPASLHYQMARATLARGDTTGALHHLDEAGHEAPGTPEIVALQMVLAGHEADRIIAALTRYSDEWTSRRIVSEALERAGRASEAEEIIRPLLRGG